LALARVEGGTFSRLSSSFCLEGSGCGLLDALRLCSVSPSGTSIGDSESNSSVDSLKLVVDASKDDSKAGSLLDSLADSMTSVLPSGGSKGESRLNSLPNSLWLVLEVSWSESIGETLVNLMTT
jgi:hypothetical protein